MSEPSEDAVKEAEKVWKEITLAGYIGGAWSWPDASKAVPIIASALSEAGFGKETDK